MGAAFIDMCKATPRLETGIENKMKVPIYSSTQEYYVGMLHCQKYAQTIASFLATIRMQELGET